MRFSCLPLPAVLLALCISEFGQSIPPGAPTPRDTPGKMEIAKHPLVLEEPTQPKHQRTDPTKLRAEADEIARLAGSLPENVEQLGEGKISKDLPEKLKRIEKLTKNLRRELTQ